MGSTKRQRFQTRTYLRRIGWLKAEMRAWREQYQEAAAEHEGQWLAERFAQRALNCDDAWHELDNAMTTLAWMS